MAALGLETVVRGFPVIEYRSSYPGVMQESDEVRGREIAVQLLGRKRYGKSPMLMPMIRPNVPGPEPLQAVSRPYRALIDNHADHPVTGLGRRAQQRSSRAA
jgi:hypothetical protein